jgi:hypothetical protein
LELLARHVAVLFIEDYVAFFAIPSGNVTLHPVNCGEAAIMRACPERAKRVEREEFLDIVWS